MKDEDFWVLTTKQDFGSGVDLSANWEDHPAFGDYAALLIKNRSLALV